jgi:hypothetical protein
MKKEQDPGKKIFPHKNISEFSTQELHGISNVLKKGESPNLLILPDGTTSEDENVAIKYFTKFIQLFIADAKRTISTVDESDFHPVKDALPPQPSEPAATE